MLGLLASLAFSTFVSEDLACIAAGVLIARGDVSPMGGVLACALGIFAGDCGLWALGRLAASCPWLCMLPICRSAHLQVGRSPWGARLRAGLSASGFSSAASSGPLLVASRFTPGTRVPLYVSAGLVRVPFRRFGIWTGLAVALWTPAVVLASAQAGGVGARAGSIGWRVAAAAVCVVAATRGTAWLAASNRWVTLRNTVRRLRRWEFWPPCVFYAPVVAWVLWLAVRHRGLTTITTCNPGIPDGGVVGESKADILSRLPAGSTIPFRRLAAGTPDVPKATQDFVSSAGWAFPLVVKPDVGQRGVGVRLVRSVEQLADYLSTADGAVLIQPFDEGPFEAGVFYYRLPGDARGRILSITDKLFPVIVGDGTSSVRQLIEGHPRYRLQSALFFARHATTLDVVLAAGQRMPLTIAGNHAQGTTFRDGWHLWTAALEERVDGIARQYDGFFIGRFDVRYTSVEEFKAGRDFRIVELNGATAESTDIYDPDRTLLDAYRVLFRQWSLVFAIGAANRARGATPTSMRRLIALIVEHLHPPQRT
jgi:membrane protein DedA with SNARE-associated domain